ncbi:MAG: 3-deoxy-manno-octulosonate cytidylyltransferase, partial [Promethearchaeota archaeon]
MRTVAIIPARLESTRLPRKVLLNIGDKPLLQYVIENVSRASLVDDLFVATDSDEIMVFVRTLGYEPIRTPSEGIFSGSDRVAKAAAGLEHEIVVNVQADEPFLTGPMIDETIRPILNDPEMPACTLCRRVTREEEFDDPGVVKVVRDIHGNGLYFSRARIPYPRCLIDYRIYEHLGIYAFHREFLFQFASWGPSPLERTEGLEMLRIIEHGVKLYVEVTQEDTMYYLSIDTKEDLKTAN